MAIYLKSTTPGKHFKIVAFKTTGRPGYVSAIEGVLERDETGRNVAFEWEYGRSFVRSVPVGRMTDKNKRTALSTLIDILTDLGKLEPNQSVVGSLD